MTFVFIFIGILFTAMLITIMVLVSKIEDLKEQLGRLVRRYYALRLQMHSHYGLLGVDLAKDEKEKSDEK